MHCHLLIILSLFLKVEKDEIEVKLRNMTEESTFNNNAQILEEQNSELAFLRLELLREEERKQDNQLQFDDFKEKIKKLEEIKIKDKQVIEGQNYELSLLMEKLRKAEQNKEIILEEMRKNDGKSNEKDAIEIDALKQKCHQFESQYLQVTQQLEVSNADFESKLIEKESAIKECHATIENFEVEKNQFDKTIADQKSQVLELHASLKNKEKVLEEMQLNYAKADENLNNEIETLKVRCHQFESQYLQISEQYEKSNADFESNLAKRKMPRQWK